VDEIAGTRLTMRSADLLDEISDYCRKTKVAESTFGRLAVNDGKLVSRLRGGGRVTAETVSRVRSFIASNSNEPIWFEKGGMARPAAPAPEEDPQRNFRFFDNRQKYLLFVNTCSEKWVVANRVARELQNINPRPPAVRLFDAGVGDGTVLTRVMRAMHARFPTLPFYVAGKEISLEDIRLTLEKMPDRFYEHPSTVLVLTNLYYSEAPWLTTRSPAAAASFVWHELALAGDSSADFEDQITELQPFLVNFWKARVSPTSGNPIYERPVALVIYREDHRFLLDQIIPRRGVAEAEFDLIIASQPYRARASAEFKAEKVVAPLVRALGKGGRLIAIHSCGNDPGLEVIQRVWPGENPFQTNRHDILKAVKQKLGSAHRNYNFNAYSDARSVFRYDMHTLPNELGGPIGTSTLFAAWNAAVYVAQIEDDRLEVAVKNGSYLDATRDVLKKHDGIWFFDETYVISRSRN